MATSSRITTKAWLLLASLAVLHLAVVFAGFLAPYEPTLQNRELPYAPPTRLHFVSASGFHLRPFVYRTISGADGYRTDLDHEYPVHWFVGGSPYGIFGLFTCSTHLFGVDEPARILLLGTDAFGRDEFSRLLYGGQISLAAGLLATLLALAAATIIGIISGYYGKWVDESLMGSAELFLSLPWLYFLIGVRAFLPLHVSPAGTFLLLICVIGLIGWARPARLVRGVVLSARNRNYVLAARGFGGTDFYLLRRHILAETFGLLLTQAALLIPQYIAAEATLSFFGLGVNEPTPSWGNMLSTLQHYSVLRSYHWLLAPAGALIVTSVIYWRLADALHHWVKSRSIRI
ncbi:MAG TPA: ABC transporter permease [Terriglobales bacterium]|nr:ABC transporter permease [Terriglobales bacterium]